MMQITETNATGTKRCPRCGDFNVSAIDHTEFKSETGQKMLRLQYFCEWCDHTWFETIPVHERNGGIK